MKMCFKRLIILVIGLLTCCEYGYSIEYTISLGTSKERIVEQIVSIGAMFYEQIELTDKTKLHIEDQEGNFICDATDYNMKNYPEYDTGTLTMTFKPALWLPKGKAYKAVLSAESVKGLTTGTYNEQGIIEFSVPEYLDQHCSITDGETLSEIESIKLTYPTEAIFGDEYSSLTGMKPVCRIYKNGKLVGKNDILVTEDLTVSWGYVKFKNPIKLEKGSEYTFHIPERSVFSTSRPDIYNPELRISVTGLYEGDCEKLNFEGYSIPENNEMELVFDKEVRYNPESCCFLMTTDGSPGVKSMLEPAIEKKGEKWIAKIKQVFEFTSTQLVYIPAGTFLAPSGKVYANEDIKIYLSEGSDVTDIFSSLSKKYGTIYQYGGNLVMKGFGTGILNIYDISGIEIRCMEISGDTELPISEFNQGILMYRFESLTDRGSVSGKFSLDKFGLEI